MLINSRSCISWLKLFASKKCEIVYRILFKVRDGGQVGCKTDKSGVAAPL